MPSQNNGCQNNKAKRNWRLDRSIPAFSTLVSARCSIPALLPRTTLAPGLTRTLIKSNFCGGLDASGRNVATADVVEFTEEGEVPPPPRLGSRFDDGQTRLPIKHSKLSMECRAVHDRGLPGSSAVWQRTCARPAPENNKSREADCYPAIRHTPITPTGPSFVA
jgi:hypothetical protein